ncbi:hypothetical protein CKO25_20095 [Thiocapsa imhoffii]|uniref:Uncharacterized protein n=2 Tax=Thiocapsa imhoffii TaxID=382777 RepID=A0A9X0WLM5_9GAMM|nr:hypothetical protein [Thiocapsa imhoffii]
MGLSGAAATKAGLALLGGGAIASGGFGMVGGATVLTAAMIFSTEVVLDYSVGKTLDSYNYSLLREQSREMVTLPLPVNTSGSRAYRQAIKSLNKVDLSEGRMIFDDGNQKIIKETIKQLLVDRKESRAHEKAKDESLLSLLYFISSDYHSAKDHAKRAINLASQSDKSKTLPAFIYSVSSVYDEKFDFKKVTRDYFRQSVLDEPNNPLVPFMFAIYLDRLMQRIDDNHLNEKVFSDVFLIMSEKSIQNYKMQNYVALLSRYIIRIKLEQQKISSIVASTNESIKNSPKSLKILEESLLSYNTLIAGASKVMKEILQIEAKVGDEDRKQVADYNHLLIQYANDKDRLNNLVVNFKDQQLSNPNKDLRLAESDTYSDDNFFITFIIFITIIWVGFSTVIRLKYKESMTYSIVLGLLLAFVAILIIVFLLSVLAEVE